MLFDVNANRRHAVSGAAAAALAIALGPSLARAQEASPGAPSSEEQAVGETMMQIGIGMATRDADLTASTCTANADWINAFGDRMNWREEIRAKLTDLLSTEEFNAGQPVGEPSGSVRVLDDSCALAWTYQEIEGQIIAETDDVIPIRKNHSLAVLEKVDGTWLITAHMWMDENITG